MQKHLSLVSHNAELFISGFCFENLSWLSFCAMVSQCTFSGSWPTWWQFMSLNAMNLSVSTYMYNLTTFFIICVYRNPDCDNYLHQCWPSRKVTGNLCLSLLLTLKLINVNDSPWSYLQRYMIRLLWFKKHLRLFFFLPIVLVGFFKEPGGWPKPVGGTGL